MAIRIIQGHIGSGKTYYAVWHIVTNYFRYDSTVDNYVSKDIENPVVVFSNIEKFNLSKPLDVEIEKAGGLTGFFNSEFQKSFCKDRKVIYLIDEAQSPAFFHRKFYNPSVAFFFQYHRHYGCDVYLITQDVDSLAKEFRNLAENHIEAQRRTYSMFGEFKYQFHCGSWDKEVYKTRILKPSKEIFALYSSMEQKEVERVFSAPRRFALMVLLLLLLSFLIFRYGFYRMMVGRAVASNVSDVRSDVRSDVPVSVLSAPIVSVPVVSSSVSYSDLEKQAVNSVFKVVDTQVSLEGGVEDQRRRYEIFGYIRDDMNLYNSFFLYSLGDGVTRRIRAFDLDRLCRCNSLSSVVPGNYRF